MEGSAPANQPAVGVDTPLTRLLRFLQQADRRVLYALLVLAVTVPFFVNVKLPLVVSPQTRALYNAVENLKPGSFVLLGVDWSGGTRGENMPQTEEVIRHLLRRKLRFAMVAFGDPQGKELGEEHATRISKEFGAKEGVNWVNWGYRTTDMINVLKALTKDIPHTISADVRGVPVADIPAMQGVHTAHDISLLIDITPSSTYQTYIQFLEGPYHVPEGAAVTSVMVPEAYNYIDSKQLVGMIAGLPGAAEYQALYEQEYGQPKTQSTVWPYSNAASAAHILIILFIVLGNIAMLLDRRARKRASQTT